MKKLALALMCLVSVAFFASCDPEVTNPEPSIIILQEDGYVQNNDVVDLNTEVKFGFVVSSNATTQKALQKLVVSIDGTEWANLTDTLTGLTTFTYKDVVIYEPQQRDSIVGASVITAIVTDVDGKTATTTINLQINQPAEPLAIVDFEWYRLGDEQTGLAEYGLYWDRNAKSPFAQIKPLDGVQLFKFDNTEVWNTVVYDYQKAALFADGATTAAMYNNVDVNLQTATYDDVIGTRMADGTLHLLHITSHRVGAQQSAGRPVWIYGQAK